MGDLVKTAGSANTCGKATAMQSDGMLLTALRLGTDQIVPYQIGSIRKDIESGEMLHRETLENLSMQHRQEKAANGALADKIRNNRSCCPLLILR